MSPSSSRPGSPSPLLTRHLEQLQSGLQTIGGQVQEAIARTIGQVVAEAIHEAVLTALGRLATRQGLPTPRRPLGRLSSLWEEPAKPAWGREFEEPDRLGEPSWRRRRDEVDELEERSWREDDDVEPERDDPTPAASATDEQRQAQQTRALATGCQVAAWCLRRQPGRPPVIALSIGLVTVLTCLARPSSPAVALLGPAVTLASLADLR